MLILTCTIEDDEDKVEEEEIKGRQRGNCMPAAKSTRVCNITTTKMMTMEKKSQISTSLKYDVLGSELDVC